LKKSLLAKLVNKGPIVPLPIVWKNQLKNRSVCMKIGVLERL